MSESGSISEVVPRVRVRDMTRSQVACHVQPAPIFVLLRTTTTDNVRCRRTWDRGVKFKSASVPPLDTDSVNKNTKSCFSLLLMFFRFFDICDVLPCLKA